MQEIFEKEISDEEALKNFLLDQDCLNELLPWTGRFNMFDVLGVSRQEKFHSQMLAWLLDTEENHGIGDKFFKALMMKLADYAGVERYDHSRIQALDYSSFTVYKDWKNIDIVLISEKEKMVIVIENKVLSKERDQQLGRFRSIVEKEFNANDKVFVFLSTEGVLLSDIEFWDTMTYADVMDLLEETCSGENLKSDVELMIRNYQEIIRRDIVDEHQLMQICQKIYHKHKKALDLIFENRMDDKNIVGSIIRETLNELAKNGRILFDDRQKSNTCFMFHTADMDEYLLPLEREESSFRTDRVYCYKIVVQDKTLFAGFELGGFHTTEAHKETMHKILSLHKPDEILEEGFKFKRVLKTKNFDFSDVQELEPAIRGVVEGFVDELMIMEAQLLFNLDNLEAYIQLDENEFFSEDMYTEEGNDLYE